MSEQQRDSTAAGNGQLARRAGLVGTATLASRILGMLRDIVIAAHFDKRATDPFFVAQTIPNVFRRLLAEGTLTVAFIPVLTEYRNREGKAGARDLLSHTLGPALVLLALVCGVGMLLAPAVVKLFALGLARDAGKFELAVLLTRVMFPFLLAVGVTALFMGALNSYGHFLAPAAAPVLLNACIIGTVFVAAVPLAGLGWPSVLSVALGVLLGGVAQVLLHFPSLNHRSLLVRPRLSLAHPGAREVGRLMLPAIAGLAVYQLNVMVARQFASFLPEGAISYLYYSQRLIEFPIGIFATAMATVTMPRLSRQATAGDLDQLKGTYRFSLRVVLFLLLPATAGLIALSVPVVAVLFQRGAFSWQMTGETAITLVGFAIGLCASGGVRQTVPVFYALKDMRTPVKVSALALGVYALAAVVSFRPLGTLGLALSVSLAACVHCIVLIGLLRRRLGPLGLRRIVVSALRSSMAAVACGVSAWLVASRGDWSTGGAVGSNYALLAVAIAVGAAVYWGLSMALRSPEIAELRSALRR